AERGSDAPAMRRPLAVRDRSALRCGGIVAADSSPARAARIGWIGIGRMGYAMAERLAKAGADLTVWNRTRSKAEPLAAQGAKVAAHVADLADFDIVFVMVSTWDDVKEVVAGPDGLLSSAKAPKL